MKKILMICWLIPCNLVFSHAQEVFRLRVITAGGELPLEGASIRSKQTGATFMTDARGESLLKGINTTDTLEISFTGFAIRKIAVAGLSHRETSVIRLDRLPINLDEVSVNTGYYKVLKGRATGSFTTIDSALLNRVVSADILGRLEGVTNSLFFDRSGVTGESESQPRLRIRGVSTIESNESPLIVLDDFPYEGDLGAINPNDVESVTILKDAAAASIWGSRAGNGVIVITTKTGRYGQKAKISFNSNISLVEKPDLFYNQNFLPSSVAMDVEKELFERGAYAEQPQTAIPQYVELLIKARDGMLSTSELSEREKAMMANDVRQQALDYLYREAVNQQYALNISGGTAALRYSLSTGYDKNLGKSIGDDNERITVNFQNTFRITPRLELNSGLWYVQQHANQNGMILNGLYTANVGRVSPYTVLRNEDGPQAIVRDIRLAYAESAVNEGLADWLYRPLEEIALGDNTSRSSDTRVNAGIRYRFPLQVDLNVKYQFTTGESGRRSYYGPETYYVRSLVNRFTQPDGEQIIPHAGIMVSEAPTSTQSHSLRGQLDFSQTYGVSHEFTALAGAEVREHTSRIEPGFRIYGFDADTYVGIGNMNHKEYYLIRPTGRSTIPGVASSIGKILDRYVSYYGNASYGYKGRYLFSGSARWDASNLFGVKTNRKGVPLWSVGASWEISKEGFYNITAIPYLRLRTTMGSSGNMNNRMATMPTFSYRSDFITGKRVADLNSVGNPSLRWEQVDTYNIGLDLASKRNIISGSFEYYVKRASDLIGEYFLDPTTGVVSGGLGNVYKINYADMGNHGVDIQLTSTNTFGHLRWNASLLFNYNVNEITNYRTPEFTGVSTYLGYTAPPQVGRSKDVMYALPWHGLNPQSGMPQIYIDDVSSEDYEYYYRTYLTANDLISAGVTVPPYVASLRNTLEYRGLSVGILLAFKGGHVFRRSSMVPGGEYQGSDFYHVDYFKRWQKPGDERFTDVPGYAEDYQSYRASVYSQSEALITKGDNIRIQDITVSFSVPQQLLTNLGNLQSLRIYANAKNLGIIWRANKQGLDPDYPRAMYPAQRVLAFGISMDF